MATESAINGPMDYSMKRKGLWFSSRRLEDSFGTFFVIGYAILVYLLLSLLAAHFAE
jgi:hypothetical protein